LNIWAKGPGSVAEAYVWGFRFRVWVWGLGFWVLRSKVCDLGFGVWGLRFGVWN